MMFGRAVRMQRVGAGTEAATKIEPVLVADGVGYGHKLHDVTLHADTGEVVVVTGGVGSGTRELARLLAGVERPHRGTIRLLPAGRRFRSRRDAVARGVAFLPADRKAEALLLDRSVTANLLLGRHAVTGSPFVTHRADRSRAQRIVARLGIRTADVGNPTRTLSGGNQQKVVLGRWLDLGSRVLVFDEPTAGVDIASKFEIYRILRSLAAEGAAVVVFTGDYQEIACIADRVLVLRAGRIVGEVPAHEVSEQRLFELEMAG
jgi:ABC-type sugar transport system ATPase subunit